MDVGEIHIAGHKLNYEPRKLRELRKDVGIVFQSYNLFPHLTGKIHEDGPSQELFAAPKTAELERFLGSALRPARLA